MVVERRHHSDVAGEWNGVRRRGKKLVHRPHFVPLKVRVANVTDAVVVVPDGPVFVVRLPFAS